MYPTIVDLCNLPANPNKGANNQKLDGFSILQLLKNPSSDEWSGNDYTITAVASTEKLEVDEPGKVDQQHYSIRIERYRYIICRNGAEELYDHYFDPYEWHNLVGDNLYEDVIKAMRKKSPYTIEK